VLALYHDEDGGWRMTSYRGWVVGRLGNWRANLMATEKAASQAPTPKRQV
jgi:hypothetical protein